MSFGSEPFGVASYGARGEATEPKQDARGVAALPAPLAVGRTVSECAITGAAELGALGATATGVVGPAFALVATIAAPAATGEIAASGAATGAPVIAFSATGTAELTQSARSSVTGDGAFGAASFGTASFGSTSFAQGSTGAAAKAVISPLGAAGAATLEDKAAGQPAIGALGATAEGASKGRIEGAPEIPALAASGAAHASATARLAAEVASLGAAGTGTRSIVVIGEAEVAAPEATAAASGNGAVTGESAIEELGAFGEAVGAGQAVGVAAFVLEGGGNTLRPLYGTLEGTIGAVEGSASGNSRNVAQADASIRLTNAFATESRNAATASAEIAAPQGNFVAGHAIEVVGSPEIVLAAAAVVASTDRAVAAARIDALQSAGECATAHLFAIVSEIVLEAPIAVEVRLPAAGASEIAVPVGEGTGHATVEGILGADPGPLSGAFGSALRQTVVGEGAIGAPLFGLSARIWLPVLLRGTVPSPEAVARAWATGHATVDAEIAELFGSGAASFVRPSVLHWPFKIPARSPLIITQRTP